MYKVLESPLNYGGITLKNRIIFAPTTLGLPREEQLQRLREIAAGGCAMIIIGDVPVLPHGFGPSLYNKRGFAWYRDLADTAHREGCLICAQLHQSDSNFKGMMKYIPGVLTGHISQDELREIVNRNVGPYISGLTEKKVNEITSAFGTAAELAVQAGFDMVQVHGDRMCGSFSSAVFNSRSDRYGGSTEKRARFAVEAVSSIRSKLPSLPIDYKLAVRLEHPHYGNAGVLEEELSVFVPLLEQAGVTSFHVTLADHGKLSDTIPPRNHPYFGDEGCFLRFCDTVRGITKLPVCAVGGLTDPTFIEEQLEAGRMDCVAMSRQLIADGDWPRKVMEGREREINRCIRCNKECLGGMMSHRGVHCIYERKDKK